MTATEVLALGTSGGGALAPTPAVTSVGEWPPWTTVLPLTIFSPTYSSEWTPCSAGYPLSSLRTEPGARPRGGTQNYLKAYGAMGKGEMCEIQR